MTTMSAAELCDRVREVRRAISDGGEVALTYYNKLYARVVPPERIDRLEAENERLRARVAELEGALA